MAGNLSGLSNAKEYGRKLPEVLKGQPDLRVSKKDAKEFQLCKKCLVGI